MVEAINIKTHAGNDLICTMLWHNAHNKLCVVRLCYVPIHRFIFRDAIGHCRIARLHYLCASVFERGYVTY